MAKLQLKKIDPDFTGSWEKTETIAKTQEYLNRMYRQLYLMFAENKRSLLIILQGIDASGKDGTIQHIFCGANPQGIRAYSFKKPSELELQHDFLWRCHTAIPPSGQTVIFNRSYYEEVTTVMVHPELLAEQRLPDEILKRRDFFERRYRQINDFEKIMAENGTVILKFLLHISKSEQKIRLEERLRDPEKKWKFSLEDVKERKYWNQHMNSFEKMLINTDTKYARWHIVPANKKWYRNYYVSKVIVQALEKLDMHYPNLQHKKIVIK